MGARDPVVDCAAAAGGMMGEGVPKDLVLAYMWNNLAAARGVELALEARDALEADLTSAQIAEAQPVSREWKPKN